MRVAEWSVDRRGWAGVLSAESRSPGLIQNVIQNGS